MSLLATCRELFGTDDLYSVLDISRDANEAAVKRAYRKLSLRVHPDRAEPDQRDLATRKFQVVSKVHSILSDSESRAVYDETGEVDEKGDSAQDRDWDEYWRLLYPKISLHDIRAFAKEYKGSGEELEDLKTAYEEFGGDMDQIMENVICAEAEDEESTTDTENPTELKPETEYEILVGFVFDVSQSMESHITAQEGKDAGSETDLIPLDWHASMFRVVERFLETESSIWNNGVFALGTGANREPSVFDLLRSLSEGDPVMRRVEERKNLYKENFCHKLPLVSNIIRRLQNSGAPNIRHWVSYDLAESVLTFDEAARLLASICEDPDFVYEIVHSVLPSICRDYDQAAALMKEAAWEEKANFGPEGSSLRTNDRPRQSGSCEEQTAVRFDRSVSVPDEHDMEYNPVPPRIQRQTSIHVSTLLEPNTPEPFPPPDGAGADFDETDEHFHKQMDEATVVEFRRVKDRAQRIWDGLHPQPKIVETGKIVLRGESVLKILKQSAPGQRLSRARLEELTNKIKPYIYGPSSLGEALSKAVEIFRVNKARTKLLFVLSDGEASGSVKENSVAALRELGVKVVCCVVNEEKIDGLRLYCQPEKTWGAGTRFMYEVSSTITTQHIPRTIFLKRNWTVDLYNNETRLFFHVNNPELLKDATQLIRDVVCSQDALCDMIGSVTLDMFINQDTNCVTAKKQEGATCYANAVAIVIYMALKRIHHPVGYRMPTFQCLRRIMINQFGKKGAEVKPVLEMMCPKYRLKYKKVNIFGALNDISCNHLVVATFALSDEGLEMFEKFYKEKPKGILTDAGPRTGKTNGHAVVLTSYNSECLRFMNSWGTKWADSGFFKVRDHLVLPLLTFYSVFWDEEDLTESEKEAYESSKKAWTRELIQTYKSLVKLKHECPKCNEMSLVIDYSGGFDNAKCPKCSDTFSTDGIVEMRISLYLRSLCDDN